MELLKKLASKFKPGGTVEAEAVIAREKACIEKTYAEQFDRDHREYLENDYRTFVEEEYPAYVEQHYPHLAPNASRYPHPKRPWYGLALSGGGIRSASFAIGVIQGLRNQRYFDGKPSLFDRITYLSTASGGGYTGSSLSWYRKIHNLFPFGNASTYAGSQNSSEPDDKVLSYIRQHGKYLTPAQLGLTSLIGTILLSIVHSVVAYTLFFSVVMMLLSALVSLEAVDTLLSVSIVNESSAREFLEMLPRMITSVKRTHVDHDEIAFSAFFLSVSLLVAAAFLAVVFIYGLTSFIRRLFTAAYCYRIHVQSLLGKLLKLLGASLFLAALPLAVVFAFSEDLKVTDPGFFSSLISGLVGTILAIRNFRQKAERSDTGGGLANTLITGLSVLVFIFSIFLISYMLGEAAYDTAVAQQSLLWPAALSAAALVVTLLVNINQVSPHKMYRDRLMETFLKTPKIPATAPLCEKGSEANETTLEELAASDHWTPYHLINCNVILNNAITPRFHGRQGDSFLLSPLYCGSDATDYIDTGRFVGGKMTLATAMSISGAAENPHAGVSGKGKSVNPFVAFLMTFLGLRLGYWAYSPATCLRKLGSVMRPNYIFPGLYSLLNFGHQEKSLFLELSDGGHFDNTAIYELVRRRTPVIILADGSADPDFTFDDFGNAIERIRVDFGVSVRFHHADYDLSGILPGSQAASSKDSAKIYDEKYNLAVRGYAIGDILYPATETEPGFIGRFVYIKSTLTRNLPGDLYAYKAAHANYPDQPTLDQFFDERQFEAYRELGYQLTRQMVKDKTAMAMLP